jgi:hypothetical protein
MTILAGGVASNLLAGTGSSLQSPAKKCTEAMAGYAQRGAAHREGVSQRYKMDRTFPLGEGDNFRQVGKIRVLSLIGRDKRLQAEAEFVGRDPRVQKDIDNLIERELRAERQAAVSTGFGRSSMGNGYFELKSRAGGRVYIKRIPNDSGGEDVYVLGKATKTGSGNDYKVLNILREKYSDLPPPPDAMSDRRGK